MIAISPAEVSEIRSRARAYYAPAAALSGAAVDAALPWAYYMTGRGAFADAWTEAMARAVAHRLEIAARTASVGPGVVGAVTSISERTRSIGASATAPSPADADWSQTGNGLAWLALRDSRAAVAAPLAI